MLNAFWAIMCKYEKMFVTSKLLFLDGKINVGNRVDTHRITPRGMI